jgi:hypothetical protein
VIEPFETESVKMERRVLVTIQAPIVDVDRIIMHVTKVTPLIVGKYDTNVFVSASGIERYRPLDGAAAGFEAEVRKRPEIVEISFELDDDGALVSNVIEAIFYIHSYEEPVIRVAHIVSSRSKGLDDKENPNRWWNTTGDWKQPA